MASDIIPPLLDRRDRWPLGRAPPRWAAACDTVSVGGGGQDRVGPVHVVLEQVREALGEQHGGPVGAARIEAPPAASASVRICDTPSRQQGLGKVRKAPPSCCRRRIALPVARLHRRDQLIGLRRGPSTLWIRAPWIARLGVLEDRVPVLEPVHPSDGVDPAARPTGWARLEDEPGHLVDVPAAWAWASAVPVGHSPRTRWRRCGAGRRPRAAPGVRARRGAAHRRAGGSGRTRRRRSSPARSASSSTRAAPAEHCARS